MADMGAEVIKIEPPATGDEARHHGPFPKDIPHIEKSGLFLYLNTNKYGVTLDPTKPAGKEVFLKLIKDADIFVQNQSYPALKKAGLDYDSLKKVNPGLIMISLSPYGLTGPYKDWKAYDINICALGGISAASGDPSREPIVPPQCQAHFNAGTQASVVAMISVGSDRPGQQIVRSGRGGSSDPDHARLLRHGERRAGFSG